MPKRRRSSKRSASARKGARTRARKATARSRAARRGALTRRRRGNPAPVKARRRNRGTRAGMRRRTARRAYRKNPGGGKFDLGKVFKETMGLAGPAALVLFSKNWLNNWTLRKDEATGQTTQTLGQRVGPLFPLVFDVAALWAVPRFALKGQMTRYRRDFTTIMGVFITLDVFNLISYAARRGWSLADDKLMVQGQDGYPEWTDMLSNVEPQAMTKLEGYHGHPGHARPYLQGAGSVLELPAHGKLGSVYDQGSGRWVAVVNASTEMSS